MLVSTLIFHLPCLGHWTILACINLFNFLMVTQYFIACICYDLCIALVPSKFLCFPVTNNIKIFIIHLCIQIQVYLEDDFLFWKEPRWFYSWPGTGYSTWHQLFSLIRKGAFLFICIPFCSQLVHLHSICPYPAILGLDNQNY